MAAAPFNLTRVASLKSPAEFRAHCAALGVEIPCDDEVVAGGPSPLSQPVAGPLINGKRIGNRWAIHPMEGWDGTSTGGATDAVRRRWQRFGTSGAKLICGAEAMAVRADGRANPNQLIITEGNQRDLAELVRLLKGAHASRFGTVDAADDLVVGFQLTHSGRFCKPHDKKRFEPRVAFRHPILDRKFGVTSDAQVFSDDELERLQGDYITAAQVAWEAGADFVDLKHCHGYLLHELLGAHTRPGRFGGSFENRTRMLREVVAGIRAMGNGIGLGVRLSCFDMVPHRPDPARAIPGKLGPGIPEDFAHALPYRFGFSVDAADPTRIEMTEAFEFVALCARLGVQILNVTAGSPYYTPHIQRPAAYPPSDGYQPAHDPLMDVARLIHATRQLRERAPSDMLIVGTGYSYLQEYLPHVAQRVVRDGWTDMVGLGRMVLSYPALPAEVLSGASLTPKLLCRTFSDCTTAPRNGLPSGCYPLDPHYAASPEAVLLKNAKRGSA